MKTKVLVTYATKHGSTQEVAEAVSKTLREHGLAVDLQSMRRVRALDGYSAVVLGAPLYMFHWHKDALRFLARHKKALMERSVAVFGGGPTATEDSDGDWEEVQKHFDAELAKFPWLSPLSVELVGGRFDPARLRFPYSLIPALCHMPASDLRDWAAIHSWASNLALQLAGETV